MSATPMTLTLEKLKEQGYVPFKTEHWNSFARIRQDLFGFADCLALKKGEVVAIQCTSWANVPARVKKIADHENIGIVRDAGIRVLVWGWKKVARGQWDYREVDCS